MHGSVSRYQATISLPLISVCNSPSTLVTRDRGADGDIQEVMAVFYEDDSPGAFFTQRWILYNRLRHYSEESLELHVLENGA